MKPSRSLNFSLLFITGLFILLSCNKSENIVDIPTGIIQLEVTDAPIDNAEVAGAFITISQIIIDGDTNLLTERHSIDLLAYQNGNTKILGLYQLPGGSYNHLDLVLDLQQDAFGNTPGCYVATKDGKKHNLYPSSNLTKTLTLPINDLTIKAGNKTEVVLDFDLRKLIKAGSESQIKYQFVEDNMLELGIRVLNKQSTGSIKGLFQSEINQENKIVVFAYREGTYHVSREIKQHASIPNFPSAQNSALVSREGEFTIAFLEKGTYHLVFAAFHPTNGSNLLGVFEVRANSGIDLTQVNIEAGNQTIISGKILQVMPI